MASGRGSPEFIAEYVRTEGVNESTDPTHLVVTTPLFAPSNGEQSGVAIDDATCSLGPPPCLVFDAVSRFRYPDGEVTVHQQITAVPDPQRPGFVLLGGRPQSDNIVSASGAYAGRTGRNLFSGSADMRNFPALLPFEGIHILEFN